jgi:hypothetical protein
VEKLPNERPLLISKRYNIGVNKAKLEAQKPQGGIIFVDDIDFKKI